MRTSVKLCFTALTAALLLASAIATTSARNLSVSNQRFRVSWQELQFISPGILTIECHVTLEGSFHYRTILKDLRRLIGYITRVAIRRPCRNGEAWAANGTEAHPRLGTLANTLPWHITYEGFEGTLPCITALFLLLRGARFKIHGPFNTLGLYGEREDNILGRATRDLATGAITTLAPVPGRASARLVNCLGGICPGSGNFENGRPGQVFLLNTTTRITVTLI